MRTFREQNVTSGELQFDEITASAWFEYQNASTGRRYQVWFDDARSVSTKSQFAFEKGLHGVAFYAADALKAPNVGAVEMWAAANAALPSLEI